MKFVISTLAIAGLTSAMTSGEDCQTDEDCLSWNCCGFIYAYDPAPADGHTYWINQNRHMCHGDSDAYFYDEDDNEFLFKCKHP